jgi:peptidoglycan hydrolase-like protein with peptidoglycan-binding domain
LFCVYEDGIDNPDMADTVKYWQTKLAALGQDTGGVDGRYHDKTKLAVQAVVAGSDGMRIGGSEAAQIDVALAKLGPEARGGVSHQHDEYAPTEHSHVG